MASKVPTNTKSKKKQNPNTIIVKRGDTITKITVTPEEKMGLLRELTGLSNNVPQTPPSIELPPVETKNNLLIESGTGDVLTAKERVAMDGRILKKYNLTTKCGNKMSARPVTLIINGTVVGTFYAPNSAATQLAHLYNLRQETVKHCVNNAVNNHKWEINICHGISIWVVPPTEDELRKAQLEGHFTVHREAGR